MEKPAKTLPRGMSGGTAYVLDMDHQLYKKLNKDMVTMSEVTEKHDIAELKNILKDYEKETSSALAKDILEHSEDYLPGFKKILPTITSACSTPSASTKRRVSPTKTRRWKHFTRSRNSPKEED